MGRLITLQEFQKEVSALPVPRDIKVKADHSFEVVGDGKSLDINFAGMKTGPLPMYQLKGLAGSPGIDLTKTRGHLYQARSGSEESMGVINRQVTELNQALRACDLSAKPMVMRVAKDKRGTFVGGIVTEAYAPLTHVDILDRMSRSGMFYGAMVHRTHVSVARMRATLMFEGGQWKVDGGLKTGMRIGNGQFGDFTWRVMAMLFRVICTNGMIDVQEESSVRRRHVGDAIDLESDIKFILERSDEMVDRSKISMETDLDVVAALVGLYRRNFIGRGPLRASLLARSDVSVTNGTSSLWGLSQSLTRAAHEYGFAQMNSLGELAGQLVMAGWDDVANSRPIVNDSPDDILEEMGLAA